MLANELSSTQGASRAKRIGRRNTGESVRLNGMKSPRDPYRLQVGERLRITAAELGFASALALANHLNIERGTVDAWFNGRALPPVPILLPFCEQWGLTLDWIFKGDPSGLPLSRNIRLVAAVQGMPLPAARRLPGPGDEPPPRETWAELDHNSSRKPVRRRLKAPET
jgi:transcriptional regulator with XRE-family HTH domain